VEKGEPERGWKMQTHTQPTDVIFKSFISVIRCVMSHLAEIFLLISGILEQIFLYYALNCIMDRRPCSFSTFEEDQYNLFCKRKKK